MNNFLAFALKVNAWIIIVDVIKIIKFVILIVDVRDVKIIIIILIQIQLKKYVNVKFQTVLEIVVPIIVKIVIFRKRKSNNMILIL